MTPLPLNVSVLHCCLFRVALDDSARRPVRLCFLEIQASSGEAQVFRVLFDLARRGGGEETALFIK